MLSHDTYSQPDAADPVLDEATVCALARRHVPSASRLTGVDESGGEARTYAIDQDVIIKTQRPHRLRPRTSLEKEVFFLDHLASDPEIHVPSVLGYGRYGDIEYICMSRMSGVAASTLTLEGPARTKVLQDLGRTLRRIHGVPQAPFYANPLFPGVRDREEFARRVEESLGEAVAGIATVPSTWTLEISPQQLSEVALATLPPAVDIVALHSNPGPAHVFVDPETLELTGLIDFGDAYIGHPSFDWRWPRPEDRRMVLNGYEGEGALPDDFLAAWRSTMVLREMAAFASRPASRGQALENLGWLARELELAR